MTQSKLTPQIVTLIGLRAPLSLSPLNSSLILDADRRPIFLALPTETGDEHFRRNRAFLVVEAINAALGVATPIHP